ncbi:MAG: hypothetical protein V3V81_04750 [Candidatus Bathyarchaeia archaeon]
MERTYKWLTYWGLGTTALVAIVTVIVLAAVFLGVDPSTLLLMIK